MRLPKVWLKLCCGLCDFPEDVDSKKTVRTEFIRSFQHHPTTAQCK